jgi:hypothetical protein
MRRLLFVLAGEKAGRQAKLEPVAPVQSKRQARTTTNRRPAAAALQRRLQDNQEGAGDRARP